MQRCLLGFPLAASQKRVWQLIVRRTRKISPELLTAPGFFFLKKVTQETGGVLFFCPGPVKDTAPMAKSQTKW